MLDSVDDTKLTGKSVLGELIASDELIEEIIDDEKARKVFTFALVGRNKTFFHPDVLANLAQGDGNANSKKDADIRYVNFVARKRILVHVLKAIKLFINVF